MLKKIVYSLSFKVYSWYRSFSRADVFKTFVHTLSKPFFKPSTWFSLLPCYITRHHCYDFHSKKVYSWAKLIQKTVMSVIRTMAVKSEKSMMTNLINISHYNYFTLKIWKPAITGGLFWLPGCNIFNRAWKVTHRWTNFFSGLENMNRYSYIVWCEISWAPYGSALRYDMIKNKSKHVSERSLFFFFWQFQFILVFIL